MTQQQPTPVLLFGGFPSDSLLALLTQVQLANGMIAEDNGTPEDLLNRRQDIFRRKVEAVILTAIVTAVKENAQGLNFLPLSIGETFTARFIAQLAKEFEAITGKLPDENKEKIMGVLYQEMFSLGEIRNEKILFRYSDGQFMARACYDPPLTPTATE